MSNLWTWGGEYFGYRNGDELWTHDGKHVGRFYDDEVFASNGLYLGEIRNENRLITKISKSNRRRSCFTPKMSRIGRVKYVNYVGYVMYIGHEDFPSPSSFA